MECFKKAVESQNNNVRKTALVNIGYLYQIKKNSSHAIEYYKKTLEIDDRYLYAIEAISIIYFSSKADSTGLGYILSGDDVISLENAFIYAGCPTVVASLWGVSDDATLELMTQFYSNLTKGMDKASCNG